MLRVILSVILDIDSMSTLAERFQASKGDPVEVDGRAISPIYVSQIDAETEVSVAWLDCDCSYRQGIQLKIDSGSLEVNGLQDSTFLLWRDTSPDSVTILCRPGKNAKLKIWNVWEIDGLVQAWVGNSGIDVVTEDDGQLVLNCSNGPGAIDFRGLVVRLKIG